MHSHPQVRPSSPGREPWGGCLCCIVMFLAQLMHLLAQDLLHNDGVPLDKPAVEHGLLIERMSIATLPSLGIADTTRCKEG